MKLFASFAAPSWVARIPEGFDEYDVVALFGNAAAETFTASIYPFILRSVKLSGINANHSVDRRRGGGIRGRAVVTMQST